MKKQLAVMLLCLFVSPVAIAGVPAFVTYSGRLTDGTGWGESTEATLVFNLYNTDAPQAEPFWYTTHENVPIVDGYFTVNLGMCPQDGGPCVTNPADATFPADLPDQMWVGVELGGVELSPRQPVGSVPYATRAGTAHRTERTEITTGGMKYSLNAVYRGSTYNSQAVAVIGGSFNDQGQTKGKIEFAGAIRLRAAKLACEAALDSQSAHMCTAQDVSVSAQLGLMPLVGPKLWITTSVYAMWPEKFNNPQDWIVAQWGFQMDCHGWNHDEYSADANHHSGTVWNPEMGGYVDYRGCHSEAAIACCDYPED